MPRHSAGPRSCIFCGMAPVTAEHILPRWLSEYLPVRMRVRRTGSDHPSTQWRERGVGQRTRAVCATCNNGWMSVIEQEAKPHLVRLLKGSPTLLNRDAQAAVATWAFKTSCVMSTTRRPNLVSRDQLEVLWNRHRPPAEIEVLAGRYEGRSQMWIDHHGLRFEPSLAASHPLGDTYMTVIQIRALVLVVFCDLTRGGRSLARAAPFSLMPVWPLTSDQRWPPQSSFSDKRLETLMGHGLPTLARGRSGIVPRPE